jgi:hypothetical protein
MSWSLRVGPGAGLPEQARRAGLGAGGALAVDDGERFAHGRIRLDGFHDGAVGSDGCSGDQGERKGVAGAGVDLGGVLGAVDHEDRVVGAFAEAVDADFANGAAEGVHESGAELGAERPGELGAVAQEAEGEFDGVFAPDPDWQASIALALLEQDDVVVLAGVGDAADVADLHVEEVAVGGG